MRADDLRVERAAVAATERSLLRAGLFVATPLVDEGIDLLAFQSDPLRVLAVQVKGIGLGKGMTVYRKYARHPNLVVAYVVDPLGPDPDIFVMTGSQAWKLPTQYRALKKKRGMAPGATDHRATNPTYRWGSGVPKLLVEMLQDFTAEPGHWTDLFERFAVR